MSEDATLLRRFVATRANTEFETLVRRHLDAVYSTALRRVGGDAQLAEDVTQQTFVNLARCAASLASHPAPGAWLHRVTRNLAANAVRAERRRKAREEAALAMDEISSETPAAHRADWSRVSPLIDEAIDGLAESDRVAVVLRFFENRPFAEIGAALRLSEDAARMRVDRALDKLRSALARRGVTSTSVALGLALSQHAVAAAPASLAVTTISAAAAGSAGGGLLGILQTMTATKLLGSVALATLVVLSIGSASHEISRERENNLALAAMKSDEAASARQLRELQIQIAAAEQERTARQQEVAQAEKRAAEAARIAAAKAERAAHWDATAEGKAFMERHPEVRQALNDWVDGITNYQWSGLYEQLGLNAAQIAEFQKLRRNGFLYGQSLEPDSLMMSFPTGDVKPWNEIEAQTRHLLGDEGYRKYQSYMPLIPVREFTAQIAGALTFSDHPLIATQLAQLSDQLLATHAVRYGPKGLEYDWDKIATTANTILSPEQRTALNGLRTQEAFDKAYNETSAALSKPSGTP